MQAGSSKFEICKKKYEKTKGKDKRPARTSKSVKQSNTHVSESKGIVTDKTLQGVSVKQRIGQIKSMSMDLNCGNIIVNTHRSRTLTCDVTADFANYDVSTDMSIIITRLQRRR